jgi:hypothetical protein
MAQQRGITSLVIVLAFACAANAGFAQTQATTTNATQPSGGRDQSAAALAQEASNPFASSWALQLQQNNNWTGMPRGDDRMQSDVEYSAASDPDDSGPDQENPLLINARLERRAGGRAHGGRSRFVGAR